jgi:hypothetical protein
VVGEAQVLTQPVDVIEDLRQYRTGDLSARSHRPRLGISAAPMIQNGGGGAILTIHF